MYSFYTQRKQHFYEIILDIKEIFLKANIISWNAVAIMQENTLLYNTVISFEAYVHNNDDIWYTDERKGISFHFLEKTRV